MAGTIFAAIDIGSFEIGMKIYEITRKTNLKELNDVRYNLELGKDVYNKGRIERGMVDMLCAILLDFDRMMKEFAVTDYRVFATSAFRELRNSPVILEQIYQRTGMHIDILSTAEQHFLGYKSIAANEAGFKKMIQKGTAILEVGGGNLQVSLFDKDALVTTQNLKMGNMRIRERLKELERETNNYEQLIREFVRNDIISFQRLFLKDREIKNVIIMGDFLTDTIFRGGISDRLVTMEEYNKLYTAIISKSRQELIRDLDIDDEYASLILPTAVVLKMFLDIFQTEAVWVPGVSIMDGVAYDFGCRKKLIKPVHDFENDIVVAALNIAKRYSSAKYHIRGTNEFALAIFDATKKIHGMNSRERLMLQIVALLHDCGKYISLSDVAECSYRIIMATEIVGLSYVERHVIALAVLYNSTEFDTYEDFAIQSGLDREHYMQVARLTAILRVANAMDRSHYQKVKGIRAVLKDRTLELIVDSNMDISLELGLMKTKLDFFEDVFGISLIVRRKKNQK